MRNGSVLLPVRPGPPGLFAPLYGSHPPPGTHAAGAGPERGLDYGTTPPAYIAMQRHDAVRSSTKRGSTGRGRGALALVSGCLPLSLLAGACSPGAPSAGSAGATTIPSKVPALAPQAIVTADERTLAAESYTADSYVAAHLSDGASLYVFHSLCTGSADGHCQSIDAFRGKSKRPIWHRAYTGVVTLKPAQDGFSVKVTNYAPSDPLCCPSRPPTLTVYAWNGSQLIKQPVSGG